jgi:hypothetical protein
MDVVLYSIDRVKLAAEAVALVLDRFEEHPTDRLREKWRAVLG